MVYDCILNVIPCYYIFLYICIVDLLLNYTLLFDCVISCFGYSYNPDIDIGQIEGALVMGLGHFLMEEYKYDPETGRCLTNNTWVSQFTQLLSWS